MNALVENGFDTLYCLPGIQNDVFFDALFHRTDELTPIHTRHEQGAAYMATGAALATGKPQAFCVVPGPGFLNTTAALSTAYATNAPVLALIGQIPSGAIGKGHGLLHEIPDQFGTLSGLTKTAYKISNAGDATKSLCAALSDVASGRPRPVGLEIPVDLWPQEVSDDLDLKVEPQPAPVLDQDLISQAARMLASAKSPMIVVGGGALNSSDDVQRLSNALCAPVLAYRNGRGVMSSNQELSITMPVGHKLWPKVDLVIGLGTRLQSQVMAWGCDSDLQVIHIDIDEAQLNRSAKADVAIHADLRDALPALLSALEGKTGKRADWAALVATTKEELEEEYLTKLAPQMAWLGAIRDALPPEGIFVDELTQMGYVARFAFPVYQPRTFISSGYQGTLGYGIATALGAAHARRDVPVVSITGDGGALFAITELATAVRHNIPLTTIVFNDNMFGNVKRFQDDQYGGRNIACDLASPDFVKLAQSFGVRGMRATTPAELRHSLDLAFQSDGPTLIEVPVEEMPSPWEFILMPKNRGA